MKNIPLTFILLLLIASTSCKKEKLKAEKIDFKTKYKFSSEIENKLAKDTVPWKHQFSASDYATKGDYKNALIHWDLAMGAKKQEDYTKEQIDSINQKYKKVKASDYIIKKAKENKVVIINEAHHSSLHRVFTKSLLKKLYNNGYKNLGLEALSSGIYLDSTLNSRKYPILNTGNYIKDPQFGNLVRDALEIGYVLFAYEDMSSGNTKDREIAQAKNIQKIINSKPDEKFLIHCGFAHVLEGKDMEWEIAMAERLKEYTDINPLTIFQTKYSEKSKSELNSPFLKALNITESTILLDKENNSLNYNRRGAYADITVFHPNTEYIKNRPNWLFKNENLNTSISLTDIEIEFPILVLAYKKGEDINLAVPIDITEIENKTSNCNLGLKKGNYDIVITNGKESVKFEQTVK